MAAKTIEEKYQSFSHREHIYRIPDTYIGSIEASSSVSFVLSNGKVVEKIVSQIPGLYKIFDEVLVNAFDQFTRLKGKQDAVKNIAISINKETGEISVRNDGLGIDIAMHDKEKVYTVEMIFGKLLTSTNYDENEKKLVGGKNGYGSKLTNIYQRGHTLYSPRIIHLIQKHPTHHLFHMAVYLQAIHDSSMNRM